MSWLSQASPETGRERGRPLEGVVRICLTFDNACCPSKAPNKKAQTQGAQGKEAKKQNLPNQVEIGGSCSQIRYTPGRAGPGRAGAGRPVLARLGPPKVRIPYKKLDPAWVRHGQDAKFTEGTRESCQKTRRQMDGTPPRGETPDPPADTF